MCSDEGHTPHILNALEDLKELRSGINDGLTGKNDLFLKVALLQDLDTAEHNLRKALT